MNATEQFHKNKYLVVRNFYDVSKFDVYNTSNLKWDHGGAKACDFVSLESYSSPQASLIHLDAIKTLEEIVGERIFPTYNFVRIYHTGDVLGKHVDRIACDISVTLHIHGDMDWEFVVTTDAEEEVEILLNPGDAIVYKGCKIPHWRKGGYKGNDYAQVFLHYLRLSKAYENPDEIFDNKDMWKEGWDAATKTAIQAWQEMGKTIK